MPGYRQNTSAGWRDGGGDSSEAVMQRAAERGASYATDGPTPLAHGPGQPLHAGQAVEGEYDSMTKDELAALAEERGLAKSGTKAELIDRLSA